MPPDDLFDDLEALRRFLAARRAEKVRERSNAGRVLGKFAKWLRERGFARRSTWFSRARPHPIEFLHIHKYSFGPCFRIHVGVRVLNEACPHVALSGLDADRHNDVGFEYQDSEDSWNSCAELMFGYVVDVAELWFERQTDDALLAAGSPLHATARDALAAALRGEARLWQPMSSCPARSSREERARCASVTSFFIGLRPTLQA